MKKFINAVVYKHDTAKEILIEDGQILDIGSNLRNVEEVIIVWNR